MIRSSAKNTYLTPNRITSRLHWLLICICLIPITGCVVAATPDTYNLDIHDDAPLPNLTLVRAVVPEVGTEFHNRHPVFSSNYSESVVSESRFGEPGEEADLSCVYAGLKEALPGIDIVPTLTFWEQIDTPHDVIELSELLVALQSDQLRAFQADVIVIAYHTEIDLENTMMEYFIEGAYSDTDKETAAIIVIDLHRKAMIHGSKISFEDIVFFYHFWTIPFVAFTSDPPDICNTVGRQAGAAIAEAMPDSPIRTLVVMAAKDPIAAVQAATEDRAREAEEVKKAEKFAQERAKLELEANKGNTDAQLKLFKGIRASNPTEALRWLCYSADQGNQEARKVLAEIYEYGGYIWIKEGIIERNYKLAYVWRGLSGQYYPGQEQFYIAGRYLTTAELSEAKKMLEDWQPGNCEREFGLSNNN